MTPTAQLLYSGTAAHSLSPHLQQQLNPQYSSHLDKLPLRLRLRLLLGLLLELRGLGLLLLLGLLLELRGSGLLLMLLLLLESRSLGLLLGLSLLLESRGFGLLLKLWLLLESRGFGLLLTRFGRDGTGDLDLDGDLQNVQKQLNLISNLPLNNFHPTALMPLPRRSGHNQSRHAETRYHFTIPKRKQ